MKMLLGIAAAILTGHVCAAGRPTLDELPAPVRSTFVHAYLEDGDPDKYSELFLEPAVIEDRPGVIVTLRVNDGKNFQQAEHRFSLPEKDAGLCNEAGSVMRHGFRGEVGEQQWKVAQPFEWRDNQSPARTYAQETSPVDIVGTELCVAHFTDFGDDLHERAMATMAERLRAGEERSAAKQARHEADVTTLRECLRDRDDITRVSESAERKARELHSAADRLAIARASLELQRSIIESYEASASSRNQYNRQLQDYRASAAEHDRNVRAHTRALERHQADAARVDAACSRREFVGTAVHQVCRRNPSPFCETMTKQR